MLEPESVKLPEPILTRESVPVELRMLPEKLLVALLSPTVKVTLPLPPFTIPAPERPLMVSEKPLSKSVPVSTTFPVPEETEEKFGIWFAAPRARIWVAKTVVAPA